MRYRRFATASQDKYIHHTFSVGSRQPDWVRGLRMLDCRGGLVIYLENSDIIMPYMQTRVRWIWIPDTCSDLTL